MQAIVVVPAHKLSPSPIGRNSVGKRRRRWFPLAMMARSGNGHGYRLYFYRLGLRKLSPVRTALAKAYVRRFQTTATKWGRAQCQARFQP